MLLGLLYPDSGYIEVLGINPRKQDPNFYKKMGVVLEHNGFNGNLNFRENMHFFGRCKSISIKEVDSYIEELQLPVHQSKRQN